MIYRGVGGLMANFNDICHFLNSLYILYRAIFFLLNLSLC